LPVLALLAGGALSQRQIAERLGVTEQTTSRMVAGLERSGYIVRAPHAHDRRRRTVQLTPRGRRCLSELNDAAVISGLVQHDLSEAETAELRRLLIRFLGSPPRVCWFVTACAHSTPGGTSARRNSRTNRFSMRGRGGSARYRGDAALGGLHRVAEQHRDRGGPHSPDARGDGAGHFL